MDLHPYDIVRHDTTRHDSEQIGAMTPTKANVLKF